MLNTQVEEWHNEFWNPITLRWARERGLTHSVIEKFRLGFVTDGEYAGRVSIPYFDFFGKAIGCTFRTTNGNPTKYLRTDGDATLFKVRSVDADSVVVCEGEIDAITAHMAGYKAVGVPGANAFKPFWAYLFRDCDVRVAFDGDDKGRSGGGEVVRLLRSIGINATSARVPDGYDLNRLWVEGRDLDEILGH